MKKKKKKESDLYGHKFMLGFGGVVGLMFAGIFYVGFHAKPAGQSDPTAGTIPIYYQSSKDAMPFPATLDPAGFKNPEIREAYQAAKDIPEVLAQQPCYCYCQRKGHRGLLDCFKTDHAASCNICVKEALLAGEMHRQGKSAEEIRAAIVRGDWANVGAKAGLTSLEVK